LESAASQISNQFACWAYKLLPNADWTGREVTMVVLKKYRKAVIETRRYFLKF